MKLRKRLVGMVASLMRLTVFIDGVRFGMRDRTPRDAF